MKQVRLAYGRDGIVATVPDDAVVVTATERPGLPDEAAAVLESLRAPVEGPPLSRLVSDASHAVDRPWARRRSKSSGGGGVPRHHETDAQPHRPAPLLAELERSGIAPDHVDLLCATGTHRAATAEEMVELVGPAIAPRYAVHQHQAAGPDADHVDVGEVDGVPIGSTVATSRRTSAS